MHKSVCVYISVCGGWGDRSRFAAGSLVPLFLIFCFPYFSRHYCFHADVCRQPGVNSRNAIKKKNKVRNLFATEMENKNKICNSSPGGEDLRK